jgi:hypothetical protein
MDYLLGIILGFAACLVLVGLAMRHAKEKPAGKTAKALKLLGGGGPDPTNP